MKSRILVLFIVSILSNSKSFAQKVYYWSNKEKQYLQPDTNTRLFFYEDELEYSKAKKIFSGKLDQLAILEKSMKGGKMLILNKLEKDKLSLGYLKALTPTPLYDLPLYKKGNTPIYFVNKIILKPRQDKSIENVLSSFLNRVELLETTDYGTFVLKVKDIKDLFTIANEIYESGNVDWCHPDFHVELVHTSDQFYSNQYYLNNTGQTGGVSDIDINAPEAWNMTRGCNNIRVAVIDDGVEAHEDLGNRVLAGYTPLTNGDGSPTYYTSGHGEACAGIIAATHDNTIGIKGVAPNVQIVPVNIFAGNETASDLAAGINWAWDPTKGNAQILSNSWGFGTTDKNSIPNSDAIIQAISNARTSGRGGLGCVVVFASGNSNASFGGVTFPANVNGVITVGALDRNGNLWNYSSRGPEMDLVAPSGNTNLLGDVYTIDRMNSNGYETGNYTSRFGGTSAACPQVSGIAALMLSANNNLTEANVRSILQQTAIDVGTLGFDNNHGYGRVNAYNAVKQSFSFSISGPYIVCPSGTPSNTYSMVNLPSGSTVTWFSSSGTSINPTTGVFTAYGNGYATVSGVVSLPSGCTSTLTKSIWLGAPPIPVVTGPTSLCPNSGGSYNSFIPSYTGYIGSPSFGWSYSGLTLYSGGYPQSYATFQTPANFSGGSILVFAINQCGVSSAPGTIGVNKSYNCPNGLIAASYVVSPNPATTSVSIAKVSTSTQSIALDSSGSTASVSSFTNSNVSVATTETIKETPKVEIFDKYLQCRKTYLNQDISKSIDIRGLESGLYYLVITDSQHTERHQLVVQ